MPCTSTSGLFQECKFLEFMFYTHRCRQVKFGSFKRKQLQSNTYKLAWKRLGTVSNLKRKTEIGKTVAPRQNLTTYVWPQGIEMGFSKISKQTGHEKFSSAIFGGKWYPPVAIFFVRVKQTWFKIRFQLERGRKFFRLLASTWIWRLHYQPDGSAVYSKKGLLRGIVRKFQHGGCYAFIVWTDLYYWWGWTRFPKWWKVLSGLQTFWSRNWNRV